MHLTQRTTQTHKRTDNELRETLKLSRNSFLFVGVFSMFINLLMLTPAIYMLQLYDRVLSSQSQSTLVMLTVVVLGVFVIMGALEALRSRILVRVSARLDVLMSRRLFNATLDASLRGPGPGAQPIEDLTSLRQFMTGNALFGFFDAPWMPVYIAVLYLLHPWLGALAVIGTLILLAVAAANNLATRGTVAKANGLAIAGRMFINGHLRNPEALEAMGMRDSVYERWQRQHRELLALQSVASDRSGALSSVSKTLRIALQSMMLGLGAYLAIQHQITPGMMIAGSIILGRALAPIDLLIGGWKGFLSARQSYRRLGALLAAVPARARAMSLPAPDGALSVENIVAAPPGGKVPVLRNVRFVAEPGEIIGVTGPSAAGKSSLARVVLGVWPLASGKVRLSGADITQWNRDELGPYVGYLPQDIELFAGTVADNIARFGELNAEKVVAAAQRAQVHDMILHLPKGYDTPIGEAGAVLSGGQRQRIGLARAMYGNPVLVVLDEPSSNLDQLGEAALLEAIGQLRKERATVLLITHHLRILNSADKILVLRNGMVEAFGTREEVLAQAVQQAPVAQRAT